MQASGRGGGDAGQMDAGIGSDGRHRTDDGGTVRDAADHHLLDALRGVARREIVSGHLVAGSKQLARQEVPDEATNTGNENNHGNRTCRV